MNVLQGMNKQKRIIKIVIIVFLFKIKIRGN